MDGPPFVIETIEEGKEWWVTTNPARQGKSIRYGRIFARLGGVRTFHPDPDAVLDPTVLDQIFKFCSGDGLSELQRRVKAWHVKRFPGSTLEIQTLKVCEEAGELAGSVVDLLGGPDRVRSDPKDECADVAITLMVVANMLDVDLERAVAEKLKVLNDPASGHRSALQET